MTDQVPVPPDLTPLLPADKLESLDKPLNSDMETGTASAAELRAAIEQGAKEAEEYAQVSAKVELAFPAIGFIDPAEELEKMRQLAAIMPEDARRQYPESIRAKLLAHHAAPETAPAVTDEELALAIFIRRTTDSPLSAEEVEAKTTGKTKKEKAPKAEKPAKEKKQSLDDLLGGV